MFRRAPKSIRGDPLKKPNQASSRPFPLIQDPSRAVQRQKLNETKYQRYLSVRYCKKHPNNAPRACFEEIFQNMEKSRLRKKRRERNRALRKNPKIEPIPAINKVGGPRRGLIGRNRSLLQPGEGSRVGKSVENAVIGKIAKSGPSGENQQKGPLFRIQSRYSHNNRPSDQPRFLEIAKEDQKSQKSEKHRRAVSADFLLSPDPTPITYTLQEARTLQEQLLADPLVKYLYFSIVKARRPKKRHRRVRSYYDPRERSEGPSLDDLGYHLENRDKKRWFSLICC